MQSAVEEHQNCARRGTLHENKDHLEGPVRQRHMGILVGLNLMYPAESVLWHLMGNLSLLDWSESKGMHLLPKDRRWGPIN